LSKRASNVRACAKTKSHITVHQSGILFTAPQTVQTVALLEEKNRNDVNMTKIGFVYRNRGEGK
jgi:hypothetical protein